MCKNAPVTMDGAKNGHTINEDKVKAVLVLEDGTRFEGYSFGSMSNTSGEIVFQTGMVGYAEALTDPSYKAQVLTLTFPLIGNYGVPEEFEIDPVTGLSSYFESHKIWAAGLIVGEVCENPSHWNKARSLHQWLTAEGIPGIEGIDTRALTKIIRQHGTMLGRIVIVGMEASDEHAAIERAIAEAEATDIVDPSKLNLVEQVSIKVSVNCNPNKISNYR